MRKAFALAGVTMFGLAMSLPIAFADTMLIRQLELGMSGNDVRELQVFLARDVSIYPEGLTTGYFGSLTKSAVQRYQIKNGISAVGRVGPITLASINSHMAGGSISGDDSAPVIVNTEIHAARNSATFSWYTAEAAVGKVYYSKTPFSVNEGTGIGSTGFYVSGNVYTETSALNNHNVVLNNLDSNTTYYYTIVVTDLAGNIQMTMVSNTFTTTQ